MGAIGAWCTAMSPLCPIIVVILSVSSWNCEKHGLKVRRLFVRLSRNTVFLRVCSLSSHLASYACNAICSMPRLYSCWRTRPLKPQPVWLIAQIPVDILYMVCFTCAIWYFQFKCNGLPSASGQMWNLWSTLQSARLRSLRLAFWPRSCSFLPSTSKPKSSA